MLGASRRCVSFEARETLLAAVLKLLAAHEGASGGGAGGGGASGAGGAEALLKEGDEEMKEAGKLPVEGRI